MFQAQVPNYKVVRLVYDIIYISLMFSSFKLLLDRLSTVTLG
jgi:hypothetical protein